MMDDQNPSTSSSDTEQKQIQKYISKTKCPVICIVCRNAAAGYHYDIPSCNGCKTFFRRTIINGTKLKCTRFSNCLEGNNPVDMSRRVCRFCRFEKCVEKGMNPMAISFDQIQSEESKALMEKVLMKRASRGFVANAGIITQEDKTDKIISRLSLMECKVDKVHTKGIPLGFDDTRSLEDILRAKATFTSSDVTNLKSLDDVFRPNAVHYLHCSFLAALEHSKTFEFSKKLDFDDKVILLKHVAAACSHLTTAFFTISNYQSDTLILPDGRPASEHIKVLFLHLFPEFKERLNRTLIMLQRNKVDRVEYMLLKAIVMCNPAVSNLSERSQRVLDVERQNYAFCLHRYCSIQRGAVNGASRLVELLAMSSILELEVKDLKDTHVFLKALFSSDKVKSMLPFRMSISSLLDEILD